MGTTFLRLHQAVGLVLTVLACLQAGGWVAMPIVEQLDRWLYDGRVRLQQAARDERIVIVDVDEKSLSRIGRWPWPRASIAQLIDRVVDEHGAAAVGLDLVFAEAQDDTDRQLIERLQRDARFAAVAGPLASVARTLDHDARLAHSLAGRPVVLGYYFTSDRGGRRSGRLPAPVYRGADLDALGYRITDWDGYGANIAALQSAVVASGFFNPYVDRDGVVRQLPLFAQHDGEVYESIDLALLRAYLGNAPLELARDGVTLHGPDRKVHIPATADLLALVPFGGRGGPGASRFAYVSAVDVLDGRIRPGSLAGRIVLVGTSAPGLTDLRATPVNEAYPGVEIHASMLAGALDGTVRARPAVARWYDLATVTLVGVALSVTMPAAGPLGVVLLAALAVLTLLAWNGVAFSNLHAVLPVAGGLLLVAELGVINLAAGYFVEGRSRRAMMGLFGEYVGPQLVERMARDPRSVRTEGGDKELTILFADIRGFTRMAETMGSQQLREYLNEFLTAMTEVIHRHGGTVDKYIGDAVMAFWGAPVDDALHADHAVAAALAMCKTVEALSEQFARRGWPPLVIGIGINTGIVRVGDMGSRARRTYTVIGDAVNLAARFEALTKQLSASIVAGESTMRAACGHRFRAIGTVPVAGRLEAACVFEPVGAMVVPAPAPGKARGGPPDAPPGQAAPLAGEAAAPPATEPEQASAPAPGALAGAQPGAPQRPAESVA